MATWIGHLRIADQLLKYGFDLRVEPFLLGNLAPDVTGISKNLTHCLDDYTRVQPEDFYDAYLRNQHYDEDTYAFMVGCYVHLLADVEWIGNVWRPFKHDNPDLANRIETDESFGYEFKRTEYFGHDFLYLHENPDYPSYKVIQSIEKIPYSIDLLPEDSLLNWLNSEVKTTYQDTATIEKVLKHEFPYLSSHDLQTWMDCAIGTLIEMLKGKGVPCPTSHPLWGGYIQPYA